MFWRDFVDALLRSKRYCAFSFLSHYWNSIYTLLKPIDLKLLLQDHTYIVDDLTFWVGSYSHKLGCLCSSNSNRRVHGFGAVCDYISITRGSFIFRIIYIKSSLGFLP